MNAFKNWLFGKSKEKCLEEAQETYQIKEFDGKLWLTKDGALICPMDMFQAKPIDALDEIRGLYVKRNATKE